MNGLESAPTELRPAAPPTPGPTLRGRGLRLSVALLLGLSGCATSGGHTRVDWPRVAECAPTSSDVIATVSRVLLGDGPSTQSTISDRAVSELESLAQQHTPALVACLVHELVSSWTRPGAAAEPNRVGASRRGRDFLSRVAHTSVVGAQMDGEP